jgi:hypothetical protein
MKLALSFDTPPYGVNNFYVLVSYFSSICKAICHTTFISIKYGEYRMILYYISGILFGFSHESYKMYGHSFYRHMRQIT